MIWQYVEKLLAPFRVLKGKWMGVKAIPQRAKGDIQRVKGLASSVKGDVKGAQEKAKALQGKAQGAQAQAQKAGQAAQGGFGQAQGAMGKAQGAMGQVQVPPAPKAKKMGLFGRKKVCGQCGQPQEKSWDQCPYCLQAAQMAAPPPGGIGGAPMGGGGSAKTMAFMAGASGGGGMTLLGWLVPIKGAQRGELFTLKPQTMIGTDPTQCDVVLTDSYMSSKHATIKAQGGVFILEDLGSTNGTYVNDKKVKTHELVDNDFVKFGQTLVKFKSL